MVFRPGELTFTLVPRAKKYGPVVRVNVFHKTSVIVTSPESVKVGHGSLVLSFPFPGLQVTLGSRNQYCPSSQPRLSPLQALMYYYRLLCVLQPHDKFNLPRNGHGHIGARAGAGTYYLHK